MKTSLLSELFENFKSRNFQTTTPSSAYLFLVLFFYSFELCTVTSTSKITDTIIRNFLIYGTKKLMIQSCKGTLMCSLENAKFELKRNPKVIFNPLWHFSQFLIFLQQLCNNKNLLFIFGKPLYEKIDFSRF